MAKITVKLEPRTIFGRKLNALRRQSIVPVNIFGNKIPSVPAQLSATEFHKLFEKAGETNLIYVTIAGESAERPCLIKFVQYHPVTDAVLHVDFHQVNLKEKVTAEIPVELEGVSPAVTNENASIVTQYQVITVTALPTDLPEKFLLDISKLEKVGDSLKVSDLSYDHDKVEIDLPLDTAVVMAQEQQAEEVVATPATTEEAALKSPAEGESAAPEATKPQAE